MSDKTVTNDITPPSELTVEMFDRSSVVIDFDPAEVDAWCSGLWLAWESSDEVTEFIGYCSVVGGPVAALLCRSLALLADEDQAGLAQQVVAQHAAALPAGSQSLWNPVITEAWLVRRARSQSIVLGCGMVEGNSHSVLIELGDDDELVDLLLAGDPRELVYGVERSPETEIDETTDESTGLEDVSVTPLSLEQAIDRVAQVWRSAASSAKPWPSTVRANEHLVRQRLGGDLPHLQFEQLDLDPLRGLTSAEFDEANRAAMSTLQSALGVSAHELREGSPNDNDGGDSDSDDEIEAAWLAVISGDVRGLPLEEQRAIVFLEWADWLGAGIGMAREGPGAQVDGERLVDLVNRCPEVSTTIDKRDRGYVAFAFDVALELIAEVGGVVDGQLTAAGHTALPKAMATAWTTGPIE